MNTERVRWQKDTSPSFNSPALKNVHDQVHLSSNYLHVPITKMPPFGHLTVSPSTTRTRANNVPYMKVRRSASRTKKTMLTPTDLSHLESKIDLSSRRSAHPTLSISLFPSRRFTMSPACIPPPDQETTKSDPTSTLSHSVCSLNRSHCYLLYYLHQ